MAKARKGPSPDPPTPPPTDRRVDPRLSWVVAAAAFSAAIVVVASFLPGIRLWGVNQLAFLPPALRYAAFAILALAFVPPLARAVYRFAMVASDKHASVSKPVGLTIAAVVAIASVGVMYHYRVATNLLGD